MQVQYATPILNGHTKILSASYKEEQPDLSKMTTESTFKEEQQFYSVTTC